MIFRNFGYLPITDMQTPLPPSLLISLLWIMGSKLYGMGKIMKKFSYLYFSSYHRKLGWWRHKNDTKMTISRKMKIRKIWKLVFFLFSRFPIFHIILKNKNKILKFWKIYEKCLRKKKFERKKKNLLRFSVATLFRFVARFARGRMRTLVGTGSRSTALKNCLLHCFFFITRQIKIGKIWYLVFLSIQPIPDLACKRSRSCMFKRNPCIMKHQNPPKKNPKVVNFTWKDCNRLNKKKN